MQAVLLLTHYLGPDIWSRFERLEMGSPFEKFILADASAIQFSHSQQVVPFTLQHLVGQGYRPIQPTLLPGSNHFPVIEFAARREYEHVWAVEFDVIFRGKWATFFDSHGRSTADLLTAAVEGYHVRPRWHWWDSLAGPGNIPRAWWLRSFNPAYRISRPAAVHLRQKYLAGWVGHHEVTMATLLHAGGFAIEDIGGHGAFVKKANRGRWYRRHTYSPKPFRAPLRSAGRDLLVHPVKSKRHNGKS